MAIQHRTVLRSATLGTALAVALALSACTSSASTVKQASNAQAPATLKVGIVSDTSTIWPLYVAEKLFLKNQHITVQTETFAQSTTAGMIAAMQANSIQLAAAPIGGVITAEDAGSNVVALAGWSTTDQYHILTRPGITSASQLKGAKCGTSAITTADGYYLQQVFGTLGLKYPKDYTIVTAGATAQKYAAVVSGKIDCTTLLEPQAAAVVKAGGKDWGTPVLATKTPVPANILASTRKWATSNSQLVERFLTAWVQADKWLHDSSNEQQAIQILASSPANISAADAKTTWQAVYGNPSGEYWNLTKADVNAAVRDNIAQGLSKQTGASWTKYADTSFLQEVEKASK